MEHMYIQIPGVVVAPVDLTIAKAKTVVAAVTVDPYTQLIECKRLADGAEYIIIDTEVELGQSQINDIRPIERIALYFAPANNTLPEALMLRNDFPSVPHLNLRETEFPRSLCLFEESYVELKRRWTARMFLERIREWLAQTAKGILHGEDQPLEPLLPYSLDQLVLPADLLTGEEPSALLTVRDPIISRSGVKTFITQRFVREHQSRSQIPYIAIMVSGEPQIHGVIHTAPQTLYELHVFLRNAQIDLLTLLRHELRLLPTQHPLCVQAKLLLVVILGKKRSDDSLLEAVDIRAFLLDRPIHEIGADIGIWDRVGTQVGVLLAVDESKAGHNVMLRLLNPQISFTPDLAAVYNGLHPKSNKRVALIGAGALGSHVFMNLARMGWGQWTIVDDDILLPHNLARHVLPRAAIGFDKAESLARMAHDLFGETTMATGIVANILGTEVEEVSTAFSNADLIIDASASIAVARALTYDFHSNTRRVSFFLNPTGTDLVMLAESSSRSLPLDLLEMQYYRCIWQDPKLHSHLKTPDERIRYANSCRDISMTLPQSLVALHAAMASQALQQLDNAGPQICLWQTGSEGLAYNKMDLPIAEMIRLSVGEWTVITDTYLINKVCAARQQALPNETGGVLIGTYDMGRKLVYVVDTLLSPPDSIEWPTVYVRGCQGLANQLKDVSAVTANQLEYIGEWHSHPDGVEATPSETDHKAFGWLTHIMAADGLPPMMLITGHDMQYHFYLDRM